MGLEKKQLQAAAAARLWELENNQKDTAELMGVDQTTISKLLREASDFVSFERTLRWRIEPTDDQIAEIEEMMFPGLLKFRSKLIKLAKKRALVPPTSVTILHTTGGPEEFGREAARHVTKRIRDSKLCAVAWGKTLDSLVSAMGSRKPVEGLRFIPVSGQPINSDEPGSSPSQLAKKLGDIYKTSDKKRLSLYGVPARLPRKMNPQKATIQRFVRFSEDYCEIFGRREEDSNALMNSIDMVLSGIGDPRSSENDPWYRDILRLEDREDLMSFARGNIGGIWLPNNIRNRHEVNKVKEMNARSLGITKKQLTTCAENGADGTKPGVVVLAREGEKAGILASTVGLVNHYVISKELFEKTKGRVDEELSLP